MKWIACYLNELDTIIYISSLNPSEKHSIPYKKFYQFLSQHFSTIEKLLEFQQCIERYKYILLYETGQWEILQPDIKNYSHLDIVQMNIDKITISQKNNIEIKQNTTNYFLDKLFKKSQQSKDFLMTYSTKNYKDKVFKK